MAKPFFEEPFDLPRIATVLLDDKFFACSYLLCNRERWEACLEQLPELFLAFMREEIPDRRLYMLAALMFQWTFRFFEAGHDCRKRLIKSLDFIDQEKWVNLVKVSQIEVAEGKWGFRHPWRPWIEKK